jgi:hypothetical protein
VQNSSAVSNPLARFLPGTIGRVVSGSRRRKGKKASGWDPVYINRGLPWESRFLIRNWLLVPGISRGKSVGVARQLGSFSRRRWAPPRRPDSASDGANLLTASGLVNRFATCTRVRNASRDHFAPRCATSGVEILYLWEIGSAKVATAKRLVPLTFLLAILMVVCRTIDIAGEVTLRKIAGIAFRAGIIAGRAGVVCAQHP